MAHINSPTLSSRPTIAIRVYEGTSGRDENSKGAFLTQADLQFTRTLTLILELRIRNFLKKSTPIQRADGHTFMVS